MLAKKFRLSRRDLTLVRASGRTSSTPLFSVVISPNQLSIARLAVVTSRKLSHSAVVRNHLRRLIYDCGDLVPVGRDYIFFPKAAMLQLDHAQIRSSLDTFLSALPGLA